VDTNGNGDIDHGGKGFSAAGGTFDDGPAVKAFVVTQEQPATATAGGDEDSW